LIQPTSVGFFISDESSPLPGQPQHI